MTESATPHPAPRLVYAGVFLLAFSILLFEIALTRVFAILMWHHLTYMVVSIAMLGFGAAGSLLTARKEGLRQGGAERQLARLAVAYGFSVMLALCLVTTVRIDSLGLWQDLRNFFALLLLYLLITGPFLLGGLAIGTALTRYARQVNRVYFVDLVGSALGGALSVFVLQRLHAAEVIFVAGSAGVVAGFLFALQAGFGAALRSIPALVLALVVLGGATGGVPALGIPPLRWEVPLAPNKEIAKFGEQNLETRLPSATSEVQITAHIDGMSPFMGGDFGAVDWRPVGHRMVGQDGVAPTMLVEGAGRLEQFAFLDDTQAASAYRAFAARGGADPDVLVIGVGGGVDVMVALQHGARHIDAVEINTAMLQMVTETYDTYLGGLFRPGAHAYSDRIHLVHGEGRSFLRHGDRKYDVIQMSGVDSFTALSTGAYTLTESYLYTVEAVQEFYAHLEDGGYVNYSRFLLNHPRQPRETLRLAHIAYTALAELGVADPAAQIAVFCGQHWGSTMIKRGPFTAAEIDDLTQFAARQGFRGFVFDPLRRTAPYDLPADVPFQAQKFFRSRLAAGSLALPDGDLEPLANALVDALLARLQADDAGAAHALAAVPGIQEPSRATALAVLLDEATALGRQLCDGFWWTREHYSRLLTADPAARAEFVDDYPYDVSPCTDDTPFFFNYYKYSGLLGKRDEGMSDLQRYHTDYPVGHAVLLASLGQIVLVGFVLLILPLRRLQRSGVPTPQKLRWFAYFAALGLGFMLLEIALMQKLVIFLGHPTYSLSIVLTSMLGFAGIGSFLGSRIPVDRRAPLFGLLLGILTATGLTIAGVNLLLPELIGLPFAGRAAVTVALLLPLGIALGMPFPTGIRLIERGAPQLVPWAWAINGFLSVFASIFCILLSMAIGFTNVFLIAAAVYAVGFLVVPVPRAAEATAP